MKVYQAVDWITYSYGKSGNMARDIERTIKNFQKNNWQVEVQYSTCATQCHITCSALILAYTEEPNV